MEENQRLAVIGATGRTGRQLLSQALEKGLEINALARVPADLAGFEAKVTVVQGSVLEPEALNHVVAGCGAVLSVGGR